MFEGNNRLGLRLALSLLLSLQCTGFAHAAGQDASVQPSSATPPMTNVKQTEESQESAQAPSTKELIIDANELSKSDVPILFGEDGQSEVQVDKLPTKEEIVKADELHNKAVELFTKNEFQPAVEMERRAVQAAPSYWLPRAGLAVILFKLKDPMQALSAASWSVRCKNHAPIAERNFARLLESLNWTTLAVTQYKKSLAAEPHDLNAKLGLTSCYILSKDMENAKKSLDELRGFSSSEFQPNFLLGVYDLQTGELEKAKTELTKAVELAVTDEEKAKANTHLLVAAVRSHDLPLAEKLMPMVPPDVLRKQSDAILEAKLSTSSVPEAVDKILTVLKDNKDTTSESFYRAGRSVFHKALSTTDNEAKSRYLQQAADLYLLADQKTTNKPQYKLALASVYDSTGKVQNALQQLSAAAALVMTKSDPTQIPTPTQAAQRPDTYARRLEGKGSTISDGFVLESKNGVDVYSSHLRLAKLEMPKPKCKCHQKSAERILGTVPGAVWAAVDENNSAKTIFDVIYDDRRMSGDKLTKLAAITNLQEKLVPISDEAITTVTQFVTAMQGADGPVKVSSGALELIQPVMPSITADASKVASDGTKSAQ